MAAPAPKKLNPAVEKCINALQSAQNDSEKMAALFLVTKVVKGSKLGRESRRALFGAIGFKFIMRLLNAPASPEVPSTLYKSVALNVLTAFCSDPEIAENPEMLAAIPTFLTVIESCDEGNEDDDQLLMVVSEAYHCLKCLASVEKGRKALVDAGAIERLTTLYANQTFNSDEALEIIARVGSKLGSRTWEKSPDGFADLMQRLSCQFEVDQSDQKFDVCGLISGIVPTCNQSPDDLENCGWPKSLLKGLTDILTSKITEKQRNPALRLAAVTLTKLGVDWVIKAEDGPEAYQFLILLVHLSCIEVRMCLEDRSMDKIVQNDDLIGACYAIIETTVRFMSGNHFENLDEKQKEQVFNSLKGAMWAILGFMSLVQKEAVKNPEKFWDNRKKLLVCASVRCLASWLAEEAASMKEEMFKHLPFILALVFETFQDEEYNLSPESQVLAEVGKCTEPVMPEVLVVLLPALCHFTAEERGVHMLLDSGGEEFLSRFLTHNWSVYKNLQEILEKRKRPKKAKKTQKEEGDGCPLTDDELKRTQGRLGVAIMNTCNLFINVIVLSPEMVASNAIFQQIMRWAFNALPVLSNTEDDLPLLSNISSLGLLLLMHLTKKTIEGKELGDKLSPEEEFISTQLISGTDNAAFRFAKCVVRFVWDAHLPDESVSPPDLILTNNYRETWNEIKEMWFLSLQTVSTLLETLPWLADFCAESGFLDALILNISIAYRSKIDATVLSAYEDLFAAAAKSTPTASTVIKTKGPALAKSHHLRTLTRTLKELETAGE